jgi:hypothetical protein
MEIEVVNGDYVEPLGAHEMFRQMKMDYVRN